MRRVVRLRAFPTADQVERLRKGISLANAILALLWAEVTSPSSNKPLRVRCKGVVNRVLSDDDEYSAVSVNPLDVLADRVVRKASHGAVRPASVKGLPFHGPIDSSALCRGAFRFPMVGTIRMDPAEVSGAVKGAYFRERRDGTWTAAFVIDSPTRKRHTGYKRNVPPQPRRVRYLSERIVW